MELDSGAINRGGGDWVDYSVRLWHKSELQFRRSVWVRWLSACGLEMFQVLLVPREEAEGSASSGWLFRPVWCIWVVYILHGWSPLSADISISSQYTSLWLYRVLEHTKRVSWWEQAHVMVRQFLLQPISKQFYVLGWNLVGRKLLEEFYFRVDRVIRSTIYGDGQKRISCNNLFRYTATEYEQFIWWICFCTIKSTCQSSCPTILCNTTQLRDRFCWNSAYLVYSKFSRVVFVLL
jgi:hypothetical protein